jgi:hypothetical protein
MSDRKEFIWPWQKNWSKPPADAVEFKYLDRNLNRLWVSTLPAAFLYLFVAVFPGYLDRAPKEIGSFAIKAIYALFFLGIILEFLRTREWKLYIWEDGAIFKTLFTHRHLSPEDLGGIRESKKHGLSLRIKAGDWTRFAPLNDLSMLTTLRKSLARFSNPPDSTIDTVYNSHFNVAFVSYMHWLPMSIGWIAGFASRKSRSFDDFYWMLLIGGILGTVSVMFSILVNIGFRVKVTGDQLTISRYGSKSIAWKDVDKVSIYEGVRFKDGKLIVETPDKTITIPETVINYWQLVKQVKARIPSTAQVEEN